MSVPNDPIILLSYINFVLNAGIMLVYVPMLLHYVSKSSYGVYQMVGSFIGIMVVLDFGLGLTVTRFLAREIALARKSRTPHIIGASASLYAGLTG
ncbi:MAG: polysaccharide biosynthesis protein, partial [Clostridia bacterium]|nr:polysaccharide biosynthesis protein [Clostridia bacterium]